jgi:lipid-binding SYLF domain-containing protein
MTEKSLPRQRGGLGQQDPEGSRPASVARRALLAALPMILITPAARADEYRNAIELFRHAGRSAGYFGRSYGYAVFPTIGKAGFVFGAGYGNGRVFRQGVHIGDASVTQLSFGYQIGGQAYSQIIFFENARALRSFTSGNFEFGADASAVAITAGASGAAGTAGATAGASGNSRDATTAGRYFRGMAVFTIIKGGAMVEAAIAGQKFSYAPRGS